MIKEIFEKILHTLEKCCKRTHQNGKDKVDEDKIKDNLAEVLKIKKDNIYTPSDTGVIKLKKEILRQKNELFSDDEEWYMVCEETLDISSLYNKNNVQCNIIFSKCSISLNNKQSQNDCIVKANLYFYNCTFEKALIKLENITFEKILFFNQCKFKRRVCMYNNRFLSHLVFIKCHDKQNDTKIISLNLQENIFEGYLFIKNCTIENINLWKNKFENRSYFVDSEFGYERDKDNKVKLNFSNARFEDNAYFNNSKFYSYADFHECEFNKIACLYGAIFDKAPNFSQIILKDNFNALNITLNFTFDDLEKQIKQEHEYFNKNKNEQYQKSLDKFANDFRDSFRVFKNALIKDNNLLEASKFHKYELYCKEIELEEKKPKMFSKEWIDKWQLVFYRKLCDHHTDILQSLNSLILVIGIFGVLNLAVLIGFNRYLGYKPILEHLYFSLDFYNFHIKPLIENNHLFIMFVNFIILFVYLILVGFALCEKYIRKFFITISYVITLFIMITSPKILIPAMGIFTDKRVMLDPLSVLGGIYTIIFGFVVYSFVKTIRKNSIVPS
ncbi:putative membrane protein [Campylobacter lari]|uniref:pentapeptide repeat-containing protein n=1 Tax=Campylobacter lari TaxID=201 RepID=UPI002153049F|nr:pentapeptide repeat-containing protein [Campylobacter lari]MCR6526401.1 pentapeptide repeat-containing protein [Campylobacter lari]